MCPPGDGGQQGRAHSRQLINPIFPGLPHSWGGGCSSPLSPLLSAMQVFISLGAIPQVVTQDLKGEIKLSHKPLVSVVDVC